MVAPISPQGVQTNTVKPETNQIEKATNDFSDMMQSMINEVNDSQAKGDLAIEQMQTGDASHLHDVMIAVEEADVSLRMLVQIRNRAVTAYEEIMRMQI